MASTKPAKLAKGVSPISGTEPPAAHRFGGPLANPRHNGAWKKEDTARYKIEQMVKMTESEIVEIANDPDAPLFERRIARSLLRENDWKTTESMLNQVYGAPKQRLEVEPVQPKPLIDLTAEQGDAGASMEGKK